MSTTMVRVCVSPAARSPMVQMYSIGIAVVDSGSEAETKAKPFGRISLIVTLLVSDGPLLTTVSSNVACSPNSGAGSSTVLVKTRSDTLSVGRLKVEVSSSSGSWLRFPVSESVSG